VTLFYEDVELGYELPPVDMTITTEEVVAFLHVWRGPDWPSFANRFSDPEAAKKEGLRGPIVPGAMTMALAGQLLARWAGPDAFHQLDVVFRGNIVHGDKLSFGGVITDKELKDGAPWVEVDIFAEDESGNRPVTGKAVLLLPTRDGSSAG
jgi:acyl dehydratase